MKHPIYITLCASLLIAASGAVNGAIISIDFQTPGDDLITQDTSSGLEWLDLTVTAQRSYNDISSEFDASGELEGWRYATEVEISSFFDAFGGDSNFYNGWSIENNGLFDAVSQLWGNVQCVTDPYSCNQPGQGISKFIYEGNFDTTGKANLGFISDTCTLCAISTDFYDGVDTLNRYVEGYWWDPVAGHALVRDISEVPLPAAAWLFGSGFFGLIGVARRRNTA